MAARVTPIPLRLNPEIEFEAELRAQYDAKPRARRQEFLRQLLRLGWEVTKQMQQEGNSAASLAAFVPRAAVNTAPTTAAPVVAAPARSRPALVAAAGVEAPTASSGVVAEPEDSSKALKGFFGEGQ